MAFQGDSIFWVEVEKIVPNPFQPRREFDEDKLKELAESVRMYGILQPLTVTRKEIQNEDGSFRSEYELIAGERRLRASKLAGVAQVPVIIREGEQSEQEKLELAIIENLQREDLNAVDRAIAFRQLADVFGLSHVQVAKKMGRSREYVSNSIRLLALPDYMLNALRTGDISEGHCRALLMLNDRPEEQDTVFRETLLKKLSVRDVERISRGIAVEKMRRRNDYDADLLAMERQFTETLGTRVSITKTEFGGRLSIDYFTQEELEEILEGMRREAKKMTMKSAIPTSVGTSLGLPHLPGALGSPRAEELAVLTERIGLELVPETTPVQTESVVSEPQTSVPNFGNYAAVIVPTVPVVETVAVPPVLYAEHQNMYNAAENVQSAVPSVTPVPPQMTAEDRSSAQLEPQVVPVVVPQAVAPVSDVTQMNVAAQPSTPVQPALVEQVPSSSSALRDQLTSLLGSSRVPGFAPAPVPAANPIVMTAPEEVPQAAYPVIPHVEAPAIPATQPETVAPKIIPPPVQPDESDLYSIRDFSI